MPVSICETALGERSTLRASSRRLSPRPRRIARSRGTELRGRVRDARHRISTMHRPDETQHGILVVHLGAGAFRWRSGVSMASSMRWLGVSGELANSPTVATRAVARPRGRRHDTRDGVRWLLEPCVQLPASRAPILTPSDSFTTSDHSSTSLCPQKSVEHRLDSGIRLCMMGIPSVVEEEPTPTMCVFQLMNNRSASVANDDRRALSYDQGGARQ